MRFVILRQLRRLPNLLLLLALLAQVLSWPWLQDVQAGRLTLVAFDWLILALALKAARATGFEARLGWLLLVPAVGLHAAEVMLGGGTLYVAS
jgi:uncharacterized membrane protein